MNGLLDIYGWTTDHGPTDGRTNGQGRLLRTPSGKPGVQNDDNINDGDSISI